MMEWLLSNLYWLISSIGAILSGVGLQVWRTKQEARRAHLEKLKRDILDAMLLRVGRLLPQIALLTSDEVFRPDVMRSLEPTASSLYRSIPIHFPHLSAVWSQLENLVYVFSEGCRGLYDVGAAKLSSVTSATVVTPEGGNYAEPYVTYDGAIRLYRAIFNMPFRSELLSKMSKHRARDGVFELRLETTTLARGNDESMSRVAAAFKAVLEDEGLSERAGRLIHQQNAIMELIQKVQMEIRDCLEQPRLLEKCEFCP